MVVDNEAAKWIEPLRKILIARRQAMGLSQRELAKIMDTAQSHLSDLENGNTADIMVDTLRRWTAALDVKLTLLAKFDKPVVEEFEL